MRVYWYRTGTFYVKIVASSVVELEPDPYVFRASRFRIRLLEIRILLSSSKNVRKTLIPTVLCLLCDFLP
jgi:hypothetical protein